MKRQTYLKNVVTLKLNAGKCNGCGMCSIVCPHNVFEIENRKAKIIDKDACMECGACEMNCDQKAITVMSGVGCAAGILNGIIQETGPSCGCNGSSSKNKCC